jgi:hypothetical protein
LTGFRSIPAAIDLAGVSAETHAGMSGVRTIFMVILCVRLALVLPPIASCEITDDMPGDPFARLAISVWIVKQRHAAVFGGIVQ